MKTKDAPRSAMSLLLPLVLLALTAMGSGRAFAAPSSAAGRLSVQVKETKLRSAPKIFASSVATLRYGDSVVADGAQDGWFAVRTASGVKGFVHPTAVTERKVILTSSKLAKTDVDASQVVLAGKGFSKEVEKEFAAQNPTADFKKVNQVESVRVPQSEVIAFLKSGKLGKGAL